VSAPGAFAARYGPWAVVAGASEGLGEAFAHGAASRGVNVLLLARRRDALEAVAAEVRSRHGVEARTAVVDLATPEAAARAAEAALGLEVGLLVCNASYSPIGPLLDRSPEELQRALDVNCRSMVLLTRAFAPAMAERRRGGVVVMSSLTAFQGTPWVTLYGATKSFGLTFAEGLWFELRDRGVDVLACCAGATRTPAFVAAMPGGAPGLLEPAQVVEEALRSLGRAPSMIPGHVNRLVSFLLRRLLPRKVAIAVLGNQTRRLEERH
jgi:short-subunit dehydrogenase